MVKRFTISKINPTVKDSQCWSAKWADVLGMWTHNCDILSVFIYSAPAARGSRGGLK